MPKKRQGYDQDRYGATNMNKTERECGYWVFLFLIVVCFFAVMDKKTTTAAFEDGGIELARLLFSTKGAATLMVLLFLACRCTSNPSTAVTVGVTVLVLVLGLGLLRAYVFPDKFIPIDIDGDWLFGNSSSSTSDVATNSSGNVSGDVAVVEHDVSFMWEDANRFFGFMLVPICFIIFFGSVMMGFKINSSKAIIATFFICLFGCLCAFKVMVMDRRHELKLQTTTPVPFVVAHEAHAAVATTIAPAGIAESPPHKKSSRAADTHVGGVEAAYASQLAATRGGSLRHGAVERLRAVEAKLDELLRRTDSTSWSSKFGFGMH